MPAGRARTLGLWPATALVVGHTIGVGIFLTPAELIGALASPPWTFGLWLAVGVLVLFGAWTFGELAARDPEAGGLYVYLREAWGENSAFLYGWQCLLVMDPGIVAALAAGIAQYAVVLWPSAEGSERWIAVGAIWSLCLASLARLRASARLVGLLTAGKLAVFGVLALLALSTGRGSWSHFSPPPIRPAEAPPFAQAIALALVGAFYSFGGFWEAARVADRVRDPVRTLPRALALGVGLTTLVYLATTAAFLYLVPISKASAPATFGRAAGEALLGARGPAALAAVVILSAAASLLALLVLAPRMYVAMASDRAFPAALSAPSPRTGSPVRATLLLASLSSVLALLGSFRQIVAFFMCSTMVFVALAAGALFAVRRQDPAWSGFRTPGYPVTPALFIALLLAVVAVVAAAHPTQALAGALLVLLGIPVRRVFAGSVRVRP